MQDDATRRRRTHTHTRFLIPLFPVTQAYTFSDFGAKGDKKEEGMSELMLKALKLLHSSLSTSATYGRREGGGQPGEEEGESQLPEKKILSPLSYIIRSLITHLLQGGRHRVEYHMRPSFNPFFPVIIPDAQQSVGTFSLTRREPFSYLHLHRPFELSFLLHFPFHSFRILSQTYIQPQVSNLICGERKKKVNQFR